MSCQSCSLNPNPSRPAMTRAGGKRFIYSDDDAPSPDSSGRTPTSLASQISTCTVATAASSTAASTDWGEKNLAEEIEGLPAFTRDLLIRASCIGSYFDEYVVKQVLFLPCIDDEVARTPSFRRRSCFARAIADAESLGILEKVGQLGYQFRRNSLSRAFYDRLPQDSREEVHLEIGRVMKKGLRRRNSGGRPTPVLHRQNSCEMLKCSPTDMTKFVQRYRRGAAEQLERGKGRVSELAEISSLNQQAAEPSSGSKGRVRKAFFFHRRASA